MTKLEKLYIPLGLLLVLLLAPMRMLPLGHQHDFTLRVEGSHATGSAKAAKDHQHNVDLYVSGGRLRGWTEPIKHESDKHHHWIDTSVSATTQTIITLNGTTWRVPLRIAGLADLLLGVLSVLWILLAIGGSKIARRSWQKMPRLAYALVGWLVVSWLVSGAGMVGVKQLAGYGLWFVAAVPLFAAYAASPDWGRALLVTIMVAASVTLLVAALQYQGDWPKFAVAGLTADRDLSGRHRFGIYLAMIAPLLVSLLHAAVPRRQQVHAIVVLVLGVVLSLAGGTVLAMMLGIITAAILGGRKKMVALTAGFCMVVLLTGFLPRQNPIVWAQSVKLKVMDTETNSLQTSVRYARWHANWNAVVTNPAFGMGPGHYTGSENDISNYYTDYAEPSGATDDVFAYDVDTHEPDTYSFAFVALAVEGGLPALILFYLLLGRLALMAARSHKPSVSAAVGSLVALAVGCWFTSPAVLGLGVMISVVLGFALSVQIRGSGQR